MSEEGNVINCSDTVGASNSSSKLVELNEKEFGEAEMKDVKEKNDPHEEDQKSDDFHENKVCEEEMKEKDTKVIKFDQEEVNNLDKISQECQDHSVSNTYNTEDIKYEGDIAIYTDPNSGTRYRWDEEKNEWVEKSNMAYGFEDDTHVYTDADGSKYFWDKEKNAWFPKLDDDFMAKYQMSYGFVDNTQIEVKKTVKIPKVEETTNKVKGEKRKASDPTWFEVNETQNTNVYVSNLPTDIDEQEFIDFMQKCGMVMRDQQSGKFRVKLYREPETNFLKGDALCTYIKIESVDLALKLLDGYELNGHKIKVERAKFQMKGEFDPKLKPKMKKKKDKLKLKKQQEKLFDWRPEKKLGEKAKHERVVIVRNLFDPKIFDTDVGLILEFQQDLREECGKYGEVRRVVVYDRHPEGIAQINMSNPEEAGQIVTVLNGRWFMKRQLTAEIWDGRTKFKIAETDSEISQRLDKWDEFLDGDQKDLQNEKSQNDELDSQKINHTVEKSSNPLE